MRLVLALALAVGAGAPPSSPDARATTLDVIVEDGRGLAVDTLGPADFSITEQSRALTIDAVRYVRATGSATDVSAEPLGRPADEAASVADTRRLIAIFLDEFHVTPGPGAERVRDALARFVNEELGPDDLVVVLKPLESLLDIRLTSDRRAAVHAIQSFDPRRGDYAPRTPFERDFIAGTPARIESARAQNAASSLDALAQHLGRFSPARKTLIVVSEGFTRATRRRGDDLLPNFDSVVLAANRAHVSIYPVEPVNEPADPSADGPARDAAEQTRLRDALRSLAEGTAGRATGLNDDLGAGLKRALSDASGYYVLTVSRADTERDGRFHPVEVAVRRPGLTTRARKGYWAPSDEERAWRASVVSPSVLSYASQFARHSSPLIRPWFGISRGDDGQTRVSFVWEPAPRVPGDRTVATTPVRVGLSVTTLDGSPVFEGVVFPSGAGLPDPITKGQSRASFVSPVGRLLVRMAIEDVASRVLDRDVRDLVVGGFPGPVALGSFEVLRARNAREYRALAADPDATPVASRQFSRTERLLIRVPVITAGPTPVVSARLVSGLGGAMRQLTVTPVPSRPTDYQVDVQLAALANGAYTVEWTARTPDGDARDSLPFRVTP